MTSFVCKNVVIKSSELYSLFRLLTSVRFSLLYIVVCCQSWLIKITITQNTQNMIHFISIFNGGIVKMKIMRNWNSTASRSENASTRTCVHSHVLAHAQTDEHLENIMHPIHWLGRDINKFSVIHNALCRVFVAIAKTALESCCTDVLVKWLLKLSFYLLWFKLCYLIGE